MKTSIVIQARMSSSRLPGKVLSELWPGEYVLGHIITKCQKDLPNHPIIVATTTRTSDDVIEDFCSTMSVFCYRGAVEDVLDRFVSLADELQIKDVVRLCADNPFFSTEFLKRVITNGNGECDYCSYQLPSGKPAILSHMGFFAEYVTSDALVHAWSQADAHHKEHVTSYIYSNPERFRIRFLSLPRYLIDLEDHLRLTLDDAGDLDMVRAMFSRMDSGGDLQQYSIKDLLSVLEEEDWEAMRKQIAKYKK